MNYKEVIVTLTAKSEINNMVHVLSVTGIDKMDKEVLISNYIDEEFYTEDLEWKKDICQMVSRRFKLDVALIVVDDDIIYT